MVLTAEAVQRRVPVRHRDCGTQIGWYTGSPENNRLMSRDFQRMDGSQPKFGDQVRETCPQCGPIAGAPDLERCFGEVE